MIQSVSNVSGNTTAASADPTGANPANITYHTPFGDVLVDHIVTPNLEELFGGGASTAGSANTPAKDASAPPATQSTGSPTGTPVSTAGNNPPTVQSVFGANPWVENAGGSGPDGTSWQYNHIYFATREAAAKVASMFGGKVVEQNAILGPGPMTQNQPNEMVLMPDGKLINPGLVASFYTHGYPQSYIDLLLQNEVQGA